jgi:hypothetical protein
VIQPVLHLHVCADPAPAEPTTTGADSAAEPLHSIPDYVVDSIAAGAASTETS